MRKHVTRRDLIKFSGMAAGAAIIGAPTILRAAEGAAATSPSQRLNVAFIGVGGRGADNRGELVRAGATVVALCDVDARTLGNAAKNFPGAKTYADYRVMLEGQKDIDAVVVSTPDHHHFPASMMAIKLGKHVYCEKPLTHSIWEARELAKAAREAKVATQMGTQGHASEGVRVLTEWLAAGAIGNVREVHVWTDRPAGWWPQGMDRPAASPCPPQLSWDLWIGPAPFRDFHEGLHNFKWRGWWDFGTGALGDIGCHAMDWPWTALKLTAPTQVSAVTSGNKPESAPLWSDITYDFPASGGRPALKLFWYDGRNKKTPHTAPEWKAMEHLRELCEMDAKREFPENGQLYVGDKGKIAIIGGGPRLIPESRMKEFHRPEKTIPRSPGHHQEFFDACRGGKPAGANFDHAGPLAEAVLLGNLAVRIGRPITWDTASLKATNAPEAAAMIHREYRKGWGIA